MPESSSSVSETRIASTRVVQLGVLAVVAVLATSASLLFMNLPDADAFNAAVAEIFVLMVFATALLVACLVFLVTIVTLTRRIGQIERQGIQVSSLILSREERVVLINNLEFKLTDAAMETLSVLAEARLDDEVLSGAQIEAMVSGKHETDADEAAGATRIKRLRDTLGNQIVSELLVKNIARKGYVLAIDKDVIRMI
jgi:DNA-binding winged helix-turn-helix (wHTH) protein